MERMTITKLRREECTNEESRKEGIVAFQFVIISFTYFGRFFEERYDTNIMGDIVTGKQIGRAHV